MSIVHANSLAARARRGDRLLGPLLALATALLIAGWILPLMTVSRLFVLSDQVTVLSALGVLWAESHYALFLVILVFSMIFPAAKIATAGWLWLRLDLDSPAVSRRLDLIDRLGRWSMLDVFVVALTVVAMEVSLVSGVALHPGLYCFAAAVVLSMSIVWRMTRIARDLHPSRGH